MQFYILFCILYHAIFYILFFRQCIALASSYFEPCNFYFILYFVHQYCFKSLSVGIKLEFIGITAHSLFIIKMYNCDFYLNNSSTKSSKYCYASKYCYNSSQIIIQLKCLFLSIL